MRNVWDRCERRREPKVDSSVKFNSSDFATDQMSDPNMHEFDDAPFDRDIFSTPSPRALSVVRAQVPDGKLGVTGS